MLCTWNQYNIVNHLYFKKRKGRRWFCSLLVYPNYSCYNYIQIWEMRGKEAGEIWNIFKLNISDQLQHYSSLWWLGIWWGKKCLRECVRVLAFGSMCVCVCLYTWFLGYQCLCSSSLERMWNRLWSYKKHNHLPGTLWINLVICVYFWSQSKSRKTQRSVQQSTILSLVWHKFTWWIILFQ